MTSVQYYADVADHFFRWMAARSLKLAALDEVMVARFLRRHLPRCQCVRPAHKDVGRCRLALRQLLSFLRQQQLIRHLKDLE